jgi:alanyl-tRNA synthetase
VLPGADAKTLRDTMDKLKDKLKTAAIVLAAVDGDKVQMAAGVTADSVGKVKAGELVNFVAQQVGGKGGGKPDMAMAGGTDASKLPAALASVAAGLESHPPDRCACAGLHQALKTAPHRRWPPWFSAGRWR